MFGVYLSPLRFICCRDTKYYAQNCTTLLNCAFIKYHRVKERCDHDFKSAASLWFNDMFTPRLNEFSMNRVQWQKRKDNFTRSTWKISNSGYWLPSSHHESIKPISAILRRKLYSVTSEEDLLANWLILCHESESSSGRIGWMRKKSVYIEELQLHKCLYWLLGGFDIQIIRKKATIVYLFSWSLPWSTISMPFSCINLHEILLCLSQCSCEWTDLSKHLPSKTIVVA